MRETGSKATNPECWRHTRTVRNDAVPNQAQVGIITETVLLEPMGDSGNGSMKNL